MTPREYYALRDVWMEAVDRPGYQAASIQATLMNAHFDHKGVPWTADDVLGRGDRAERRREQFRDKLGTLKSKIRSALGGGAGKRTELPEFFLTLAKNRKPATSEKRAIIRPGIRPVVKRR